MHLLAPPTSMVAPVHQLLKQEAKNLLGPLHRALKALNVSRTTSLARELGRAIGKREMLFTKLQWQLFGEQAVEVRQFLVSSSFERLRDAEEDAFALVSDANATDAVRWTEVAGRYHNCSVQYIGLMEQLLDEHVEISFQSAQKAEVAACMPSQGGSGCGAFGKVRP